MLLATALALTLQTTLARFVFRGTVVLDFVLVVVVGTALLFGPVTGLFTGTLAGLLQDALSGGVSGISGLAKTIVGFGVGVVGTQFIVAQALPRFVVFFVASLVHQLIVIGLYVVVGSRELGSPYAGVAGQAAGNAVVGVVAFRVAEFLPGVVERRKATQTRLRR